MFRRIRHMFIKELIQIMRDPRMRVVIFVMPMVQLIVFSFAVTTDVRNIATAVYDLDNTPESRSLIDAFTSSGYFEIVSRITDEAGVRATLDQGQAQLVLRLNPGFGAAIRAGRTAEAQALVDGTESNNAAIIGQYGGIIAQAFSQDELQKRLQRTRGRIEPAPGVDLRVRAWFNENLESRNFYVPGLIAMIVTLVTMILTCMAVVREKEIGTIEQIMVTPIRPIEFILGKTAPFAMIGFIDVILVTLVATFGFNIPIRGSVPLLLCGSGLFLLSTLGIGLYISTVCQTQQQAMMSVFFFLMPAILLSGFLFPIANMPPLVQWLTLLNPMRYYLVIIRAIFLNGAGFSTLWPQMAALTVLGLAMLTLAASRFKKTLA